MGTEIDDPTSDALVWETLGVIHTERTKKPSYITHESLASWRQKRSIRNSSDSAYSGPSSVCLQFKPSGTILSRAMSIS